MCSAMPAVGLQRTEHLHELKIFLRLFYSFLGQFKKVVSSLFARRHPQITPGKSSQTNLCILLRPAELFPQGLGDEAVNAIQRIGGLSLFRPGGQQLGRRFSCEDYGRIHA